MNQGTPLFNDRWDHPADVTDKKAVFAQLESLFVDTDVAFGPGAVKVVLMWHGVKFDGTADDICATGLSSQVSGADQGFFGKGVYLTPEAEYAAFYANGQQRPERGKTYTLLLCAVCVANPYPVTRSADYTLDGAAGAAGGESVSRFHYNYGAQGTAKALYQGYDAHFMAINTNTGHQAATNVADADYYELVLASDDQVLPFAKVVVRIK